MTERPRNRAKPIRNVAEKPPWSLFLQFVFAIHGSRQQSRLALGIALPCHCPAMLPRCSGHAESISLNRILTYLFWSEPRYKYVCGFVAHSELYRKRLFRKANLARQSRAGTWRSNLSQRRVVGVYAEVSRKGVVRGETQRLRGAPSINDS